MCGDRGFDLGHGGSGLGMQIYVRSIRFRRMRCFGRGVATQRAERSWACADSVVAEASL